MLMAASLPAQIYVSVNKGVHYVQTDASTVNTSGSTPFSVNADISGSGVTASVPTGPNQVTAPTTTTYALAYSPSMNGWNYQSSAMNQTTMDTLYPNGTWTLEAGGNSWSVSINGDLYPNAPVATFSAGTWTGGLLYLTAAEAAAGFTVTTNTFTTNFSSGNSFVGLSVGSADANNMPTFTASSVTLNVPGGALTAGTHTLSMDFNRLTTIDSSVGGYYGVIGYNANTNVTIQVQAIPEPSTYATIAGALSLLGVMAWRRRRQVRA
jgi:hypothetical protein